MPALSRVDRLLAEAKSKFAMKWHKKGGMYYVTLVKKEAMAVVRILGLKEDERAAYTTFVNSEPKTSLDYIKVVYEGYGPAILNEIYDAFTFSDTARLSIERAVAQSNYTMVMRQEEAKPKFEWPTGWKHLAHTKGLFRKYITSTEAKRVIKELNLIPQSTDLSTNHIWRNVVDTIYIDTDPETGNFVDYDTEGMTSKRISDMVGKIEGALSIKPPVMVMRQEEAKFKWPYGWERIPKSEGEAYRLWVGKAQAEAIIKFFGSGMRKVSDPDPERDLWKYEDAVWVDKTHSRSMVSIVSKGKPDRVLEGYTLWIAQAMAEKPPVMVMRQEEKKKLKPIAVRSGAFHKWLGKSEHDPITAKDIELGLASKDGNIRRMAKAAQAKRNIGKKRNEQTSENQ